MPSRTTVFKDAARRAACLAGLLLLPGAFSAFVPAASAQTTGVVGDIGDPVGQLNWVELACPPGQFAVGLGERQGGWMAQVTLFCAPPNMLGGWGGAPMAGGSAGGNFGSHAADLICPAGQWITGMSGQMVTSYHATLAGEIRRRFLANPVVHCGNAANPELAFLADPAFKPEKPSGLYPTTYTQTPTEYCASSAIVGSMRVAVSVIHHPDIEAIALECVAAPASKVIPRIPTRHLVVPAASEGST